MLWVVSQQNVCMERPVPADWPGAIEDLIDRHAELLAGCRTCVRELCTLGRGRSWPGSGKNVDLLIVGSPVTTPPLAAGSRQFPAA